MAAKPWRPDRKRGVHSRLRHGLRAEIREFVWPSMGLAAFGRWMGLKLLRQANRPHYVALGAAIGILVAFFPLLGTHTVIIAVLCWLLRGSFIAAMTSSMVANPWTIGPMWALSFHAGRWMLGMKGGDAHAIEHMNNLGWGMMLARLDQLFWNVLLPTVAGGLVIGGGLAVAAYLLIYWRLARKRGKAGA